MVGKGAGSGRATWRIGLILGVSAIGVTALFSAFGSVSTAAASLGPVVGRHGAIHAGWSSSNWSGYAETSAAPFSGVTGDWTVPTVTGPNGSYSATWIGIDGFTNSSLIQTGTEQDYVNGNAQYSAWWTTSSQNFAEQTITAGCSSTSAAVPVAGPGGGIGGSHNSSGGHHGKTGTPSATTGQATSITASSATLTGTVNPGGTATGYYFEYGIASSYGTETSTQSAGSGTKTVSVSASISGLSASTTYDFQLVATYSGGTVTGGNGTFTTATSASGGSGGAGCGAVKPGDAISADISQGAGSIWTITLADATEGWTFTTAVTYTGPGSSAEWIVEAPSLCTVHCTVATLADYGQVTLDQGTVNGGAAPDLNVSEAGEMLAKNGSVISIPSAPDTRGDGFTCAYGATAPPPPPNS